MYVNLEISIWKMTNSVTKEGLCFQSVLNGH